MNVRKRLKCRIVGRGYIQPQVFGANSPFPTKENFAKNRKLKISNFAKEKNKKIFL